jgi:hypothetical protein
MAGFTDVQSCIDFDIVHIVHYYADVIFRYIGRWFLRRTMFPLRTGFAS